MLLHACLALLFAAGPGEFGTVTSTSGNIAVQILYDGGLFGVRLAPGAEFVYLRGRTDIGSAIPRTNLVRSTLDNGGMELRQTFSDGQSGQTCMKVERFTPARDSIRWEVEITGEEPFSTEIVTQLKVPVKEDPLFWTAWSDPLYSEKDWHDPMVPQPMEDQVRYYGAPAFDENKPLVGYCPVHGNTFCIPLATVLYPAKDQALSLVLSPEDPMLDLELRTREDGRIAFARLNHRISKDRTIRFAMDLVAHPADPRAALGWMAARYPEYFGPPLPAAHDIAGCGAYSSYEGDLDAGKLRRMAFRVNWKASFDFPYMGMFLPPVPGDDDRWPRFNDKAPGQPLPGDDGWSSVARMRAYSEKMRGYGFHALNYFNVTEFGVHLKGPEAVTPGADKNPEAWRNANDFVYTRVADGVLPLPKGSGYWATWGGAVAMDPGGPDYQAFLLDQARRHVEKLPASAGVCIDRLDWLRFSNPNADDGESWVDGRPCRLLYTSWRGLMPKLAPIFHDAGKFIFVNNHLKRIDLLRYVDGIYCEFAHNGRALNSTGLLTVDKPAIGWTASVDDLKPDPDGFFQRYLHMGVYPTVPLSGNDHTITPDPWAETYYLDYGPLLDAMRGKHWVLQAHVVEVKDNAATANLFAVPGGFVMPVTFAKADSATVVLRGLPVKDGTKTLRVEALYPGAEKSTDLGPVDAAPEMRINVPLRRNCAMLRLTPEG